MNTPITTALHVDVLRYYEYIYGALRCTVRSVIFRHEHPRWPTHVEATTWGLTDRVLVVCSASCITEKSIEADNILFGSCWDIWVPVAVPSPCEIPGTLVRSAVIDLLQWARSSQHSCCKKQLSNWLASKAHNFELASYASQTITHGSKTLSHPKFISE